MPAFNEENIRHLLRRTEIVDRQWRVYELLQLPNLAAAVDNVMSIDANPPSADFNGLNDWDKGTRLQEFWLDQMAFAPKPFGERMALFWHGHLVSDFAKSYGAEFMREQIDLYRRSGLVNFGNLVKTAAVQAVMLRYLDNARNYASSPNQNFARELMELFTLGVGNYTEADVEAATAAWTGHNVNRDAAPGRPANVPFFEVNDHEQAPQTFLGVPINNNSGEWEGAGRQVVDVILGGGVVPAGAQTNQGQPTRNVAASFLTFKLWQEFGEATTGGVPAGVGGAMTSALLDTNFEIRPWVRAMLLHDDFYSTTAKAGLVRQPIEYSVACTVATGVRSNEVGQIWLMQRAGQQPLFPPNVSGWKPNGYWVNASAMGARSRLAQGCVWNRLGTYWAFDWFNRDKNYLELAAGQRLYGSEIFGWGNTPAMSSTAFVDRLIQMTLLRPRAETRQRLIDFCNRSSDSANWIDALLLLLISPEMNMA